MQILKYINLYAFIVSLAFGIFAVYITTPAKRNIIVYPTHENSGILQYKDKTNSCFSLIETAVECPADEKDITRVPIQS